MERVVWVEGGIDFFLGGEGLRRDGGCDEARLGLRLIWFLVARDGFGSKRGVHELRLQPHGFFLGALGVIDGVIGMVGAGEFDDGFRALGGKRKVVD